ncbi:phospholipid scramblase 1-like [Ambystoma mexicanum]|uniref:phospholipid scramblase 1-like n=1 Tax=Ambystoma mexicanum TaxID=8296 RepID=UPI0037E858ED
MDDDSDDDSSNGDDDNGYPLQEDSEDYPSDLEGLTLLDHLAVEQKFEPIEALTGFETNNKYVIKDAEGRKVYYAAEKNWCCTRMLCGSDRSFVIKIVDTKRREVIRIHRPFKCLGGLCPFCLQELTVESPPKEVIGYCVQTWNPVVPSFTIQNEDRENILKIRGPLFLLGCCGNVTFKVKTYSSGYTIGNISKRYGGLAKEMLLDSDSFGMQFPLDLDVKMKAILIGTCFLLDFMYFETFECPDVPCVSGV